MNDMTQKNRPRILMVCDIKMIGAHPFHAVGEKYITAIAEGARAQPLLVPLPPAGDAMTSPTGAPPLSLDEIFDIADGIFLPGSWSNVHPEAYQGPKSRDGVLHDRQRDALSLDLIRQAVARGVPLFCVCRGFQELNVAYGGTLHAHLEETESDKGFSPRFDHREDKDAPLEDQYGPAHELSLTPGGQFEKLLGTQTIDVNSLHGQGVDKLGDGLSIEGRAPDGTIEAVRVEDARAFALGVQWHPEWRFWENPVSQKLFAAFGDAAAQRAAGRQGQHQQKQAVMS